MMQEELPSVASYGAASGGGAGQTQLTPPLSPDRWRRGQRPEHRTVRPLNLVQQMFREDGSVASGVSPAAASQGQRVPPSLSGSSRQSPRNSFTPHANGPVETSTMDRSREGPLGLYRSSSPSRDRPLKLDGSIRIVPSLDTS